MMKFVGLLLLCPGLVMGQAPAPADVLSVSDIRVEHLSRPLGIDVPKPRFSWTVTGLRGTFLSSYTVVVRAEGANTPVWQSAPVAGNATFNVRYNGTALKSATAYQVAVLVVAHPEGRPDVPCKGLAAPCAFALTDSMFSVGQLAKADWTATFVGRPSAAAAAAWPAGAAHWFRSPEFEFIPAPPAKDLGSETALLTVASVGFCEVPLLLVLLPVVGAAVSAAAAAADPLPPAGVRQRAARVRRRALPVDLLPPFPRAVPHLQRHVAAERRQREERRRALGLARLGCVLL